MVKTKEKKGTDCARGVRYWYSEFNDDTGKGMIYFAKGGDDSGIDDESFIELIISQSYEE